MIRRFKEVWEGLVEPAWIGDARERRLSRILNIILLMLLLWGILVEIQYRFIESPSTTNDLLALLMLGILVSAYVFNRRGAFQFSAILTVGLFISATFAMVIIGTLRGESTLSILYYLIIAVLMSELFFSMRGYLVTAIVILAGVFGISLWNPGTDDIFIFLVVFCALIGFSSYNRRAIEREQVRLAKKVARERSLRWMEERRSAQLGLLEEVGRKITNSLNEREILDHTLQALVDTFGYAEAAICLLINNDTLEVAAIAGTQDFGYRPGYRQKIGEGIIGHVAETRQAHLAGDVSNDPYYYSSADRRGSAIGTPMLDKEKLLGVIYVESSIQNALKPDDTRTLQTLANQVATSIQKARLYARTQYHLHVMTTLRAVSQAVSSSLELDKILRNVIELLKNSFGYDYLSIYLLEGEVLRLGTSIGYAQDMIIHQLPVGQGVIGRTDTQPANPIHSGRSS